MKDPTKEIPALMIYICMAVVKILSILMMPLALIIDLLPEDLMKTEQNGEGLLCIIKEHKFTIMIIIVFILIGIYRDHDNMPVLIIPFLIFSIFSLYELWNSRFTILRYIGIGIFIISGFFWVLKTGPAMGPFSCW